MASGQTTQNKQRPNYQRPDKHGSTKFATLRFLNSDATRSAGQTTPASSVCGARQRSGVDTVTLLCVWSCDTVTMCVFGGVTLCDTVRHCVTLCDTVRVFGRVVPINAPAKPQHSLITAFTAALIHVDRPHCEQQKLCHRIVNNVLAHIVFSISKKAWENA